MRTGRFATTPGTTTPQHVDKDNTEETAALATATQWLEGDGNSPAANISVSAQARRWTADGETARPGASECTSTASGGGGRSPIFVALITLSSVAIFNYQKLSSPVVASTLYALRTNQRARELLGDEIYFKHQIPWISGEMNQLRGRIDISFAVKGTRSTGIMRFASVRPSARAMFETTEWSLETPDGARIDLLEGGDPFKLLPLRHG
ncbi:hypothetical protein CIB48_g5086 [Xylaria polymorpha]|nr:hypothetical protein CIB48_g5086 [Xylaria polymorpha]